MDDLVDRLGALPTDAVSGADGWPEIEARIRVRGRRSGWIRVAAAAVIFVAGATGGFMARGASTTLGAGSIDEALLLAAEVQRTGTEYVAALAAFASVVDSLPVNARAQGRDAAIATLFGAATELAALDGGAERLVIPLNAAATRVRF
jgi:hypothetical protein